MNKERIIAIAEWLENGAVHITPAGETVGFDMKLWYEEVEADFEFENTEFPAECGTAMCIGGAAEQFFGKGIRAKSDAYAADLLGLDCMIADQLFYPWETDWYKAGGRQPLTPKYMAGVLRRLVDTGELIG